MKPPVSRDENERRVLHTCPATDSKLGSRSIDCFSPQSAYKRPKVCINVGAGLHFIIDIRSIHGNSDLHTTTHFQVINYLLSLTLREAVIVQAIMGVPDGTNARTSARRPYVRLKSLLLHD